MTAGSVGACEFAATGRLTPAGVAAVGSLIVLIGAGLTGVLIRTQQRDLLEHAGPAALIVAVALGMPHGALDTELVVRGRGRRAAAGIAYLAVAGLVFLGWSQWPGVGIAVLLAVSAAHFSWIDHVVSRWRTPDTAPRVRALRAAATGALAVSGPFAWWPDRTGPVLHQLGVDPIRWNLFTDASRIVFAIAAVVGLLATVSAFAGRDIAGGLEPVAIAALTITLPPLLGFAVYFAGWHAWRQTIRLVAVHPDAREWIRRGSTSRAAGVVARRAGLPTAMALTAVFALVLHARDVPAGVLIALLAVSVPHAAVSVLSERRAAARPGVATSSRPGQTRSATHRSSIGRANP
ncbi:Brp/Blh family beta-carotene 15,15'-dioxygenase [Jatrophihabitans sp. YIM 134969]